MARDNIGEFDSVAASNTVCDDISTAEGTAPSNINDAIRALMALLKQEDLDVSGTITAGGTADVITIAANQDLGAYIDGMRVRFFASGSNTTVVTANIDSIGAKKVQKNVAGVETALAAFDILEDGLYEIIYDSGIDSSAGGFWLVDLNSINFTNNNFQVATFTQNPAGGTDIGVGINAAGYVSVNRTNGISGLFGRSNNGVVISITIGGSQKGSISVSGETTSFNAFRGSHYVQLMKGQKEPPIGALVVSNGKMVKGRNREIEYFVFAEGTTTPADTRIYGIWGGKLADDSKNMNFGEDDKPVYLVTQVGLAEALVTDTNGIIKNGDFLETSRRKFHGQRQLGPARLNSTLAKSLVDVNWKTIPVDPVLGFKAKLIPVIF
ncbi:MAG: hypothetical protein GY943_30320 [Chloroflexi bacterium]|nr:hypothetical protein [Chloroflexota bacterium]